MSHVITIGSVLVDIFIRSSTLNLEERAGKTWLCQEYGKKIDVDSLVVRTGGGAGNTAVAFERLGFSTATVAELGTDEFSVMVTNELSKSGVNTQYLIRERREETGGSVILIGPDGGRTVMVHRGAAAQLDVGDIPQAALAAARWVHLSSIGGQREVLQAIFQTCRHHAVGLSWNPGKAELSLLADVGPAALGIACDVLVLNAEEWQLVTAVHEHLQAAIPIIVVTDGRRGGQVLERRRAPRSYSVPEVVSQDDTGAGDAFAATFAAARLAEQSVDTALQWAITNAASVVQQVGAKPGLLSRPELERMVQAAHVGL